MIIHLQGREPGPAFKELDPQAAGVQSTLSALKAQGLGGEVYTRDEAIRKYMELSEGGCFACGLECASACSRHA